MNRLNNAPLKVCAIWLLIALSACAAPASPSPDASPPVPAGTVPAQPLPSETLPPEATQDETATSRAAEVQPGSPCLFLVDAKKDLSGMLEVIYASDCVSEDDATPKKLWRWVEGQGPAAAFPLPDDALEPYPSSDREWILFRRDVADQEKEIWAIGSDGQDERRLAAISLAEAEGRYPGVFRMVLEYGWAGDSHQVVYRLQPQYELEAGAYDTLVLIDAETGAAYPLAPPGEVSAVAYAPDGTQIAALTPDELRLIDARSGGLQFDLPLPTGMAAPGIMQYSPTGKYLVVFATEGIAVVDAEQGTYRILPVEHILWGAGDAPPAKPAIYWAMGDVFFMATLHSEIVELFEGKIEIWQVDAATATATVIQDFTGFYPTVVLAPNLGLRYLLYQVAQPGNFALRELYLLDLSTGVRRLYTEGELDLTSWSPDSSHFIFNRFERLEGTDYSIDRYYLGHAELEPTLLGESLRFRRWADEGRFLSIKRTADGIDELWLHSLDGTSVLIGSSLLER